MYTIELVRGLAWDAPIIEAHAVQRSIHLVDVERMAQSLLTYARRTAKQVSPTDYRILDALGRCVRSSTTPPPRPFTATAGRTCWN